MKIDNLRRYIDLRDSLAQEKANLEKRLQEINDALGETSKPAGGESRGTAEASKPQRGRPSKGAKGRRGRQARGGISLREAVLQVLAKGPQTKEEILAGVKAAGYEFSTNNPMNSLGVILYGKNPKLKNENGRFGLGGRQGSGPRGGRGAARLEGTASGAFARKRRQLSPEARERIAAAQRERWAKTKR